MIGLILLAVFAAGGAVVLVKRYLDNQAAQQAKLVATKSEGPSVYVIVADENLPAGTKLTSGSLRWQKWPEDAIESSFLSSDKKDGKVEKKLVGAVMRRGVAAGTPITEGMVFRRETAGFMAGALDEGMLAVAVPVDVASGGAGFIVPGDRVDVVLTFDVRELTRGMGDQKPVESEGGGESKPLDLGPAKYTSETVLRGLRVLAINQTFKDVEGDATVAKTVSLQVSPKEAEILAVARAMGKLSLALQSLSTKTVAGKPEGYTSDVDVSPTLRAVMSRLAEENKKKKDEDAARKAARLLGSRPPAGRPAAPPQSSGAKVRIYRGGAESTQEFPGR